MIRLASWRLSFGVGFFLLALLALATGAICADQFGNVFASAANR